MAIQCERIKKTIAALAAYGALPDGGTTRLSYTPEYLAAQEFLKQEMLAAGMLTEIDPIGNLIGSYVGSSPELPAVMSGSHLDTVPGGGSGMCAQLAGRGLQAETNRAGHRYGGRRMYGFWHGLLWRACAQR